jgi:hypothetical protein
MDMNKEEFKKEMDAFWSWTAQRDRHASSWWLSLKEYADMMFNRAYEAENYGPKPEPKRETWNEVLDKDKLDEIRNRFAEE